MRELLTFIRTLPRNVRRWFHDRAAYRAARLRRKELDR